MAQVEEQKIRERAHLLWEQAGRPEVKKTISGWKRNANSRKNRLDTN